MFERDGVPGAGELTANAATVVASASQYSPSELIDYGLIGEMTESGTAFTQVDNAAYS